MSRADEVGVAWVEVKVGDGVLFEEPLRDQMPLKARLTSKHIESCPAGSEELPEDYPKPQEKFSFGLLEITVASGWTFLKLFCYSQDIGAGKKRQPTTSVRACLPPCRGHR